MGSKGVQRIETAEGDSFDPNTMEAMTTVPCPGGDAQPGTIANIWQVRSLVKVTLTYSFAALGAARMLAASLSNAVHYVEA